MILKRLWSGAEDRTEGPIYIIYRGVNSLLKLNPCLRWKTIDVTLSLWSTSTLSSGRGTSALFAQPAGDPLPFKHLELLPSSSSLYEHTSVVICSCHAVFEEPLANPVAQRLRNIILNTNI